MIIAALHQVGGVDHLAARAQDQLLAFMALLGKVLPLTVQNQPKPVEEMTDDELESYIAENRSIPQQARSGYNKPPSRDPGGARRGTDA